MNKLAIVKLKFIGLAVFMSLALSLLLLLVLKSFSHQR